MSTINSKNVQVGTSNVAAENFTLYQPSTPDGTVRLGVGNSGATTGDVVTVNSAGVTVTGTLAGGNLSYTGTLTGGTGVVNLGSGQFYKDASGNVGIGTSSPNSKLNTYAAANALSIQYVATNQNAVSPTAAIGFNVSDSSETTAACAKGGIGFTRNAAFGGGYLAFYNNNSGAAGNFTTADERARIDGSGNLLVGTTTSSGNGNLIAAGVYNNTTASGANVQVDNTGPGLLRRSTSSVVYKTDVEPIKAAYIDNALKFRPVWYRSLCDGDRKDWSWYGLIAEEVGAIDPRLVHWRMLDTSVDENGQTVQTPLEKPVAEGVMYDRVVVLALGLIQKQQIAIQEQQALIVALQADVAALKGAQA